MAEPLDPDREAGHAPSPESNDSDEGISEDDLDIDALVAVWKDDLLLDAIGRAASGSDQLDVPFDVSSDRQLIAALLSWRRNVDSDPLTTVGPSQGRADAGDSHDGGPLRHTFRVPLVSALAAAVMLAFTALAAYGAAPDEALWPVTEALYSQHAASVRAADEAGAAQAQAEAAMAAGHRNEAESALQAAAHRLPQVRSEDAQTKLQNRQRDLERQLNAPPGPAVDPGAPPRGPKTSAAHKPTSQQTAHSSRPKSPLAQAEDSHDSVTRTGSATTTPQTHPTPRPTSASSTSPENAEQLSKPPWPTRTATASTMRPTPSVAPTDTRGARDTARKLEPVKPGTNKSPPTTPQPEAQASSAASTGRTVKPSPSVRVTGNQPTKAASRRSNSPAPTPRQQATASSDSAPS